MQLPNSEASPATVAAVTAGTPQAAVATPRPGTLRQAALLQFYDSLFVSGTPEPMVVDYFEKRDQSRAHGAQAAARALLTIEQVMDAAQGSLTWQQNAEIEVAAELERIRTGKSGHKCRAFMVDETSRLLAHHRAEILRIGKGIDRLTVKHAQAAE